jgi:hypothetical protein
LRQLHNGMKDVQFRSVCLSVSWSFSFHGCRTIFHILEQIITINCTYYAFIINPECTNQINVFFFNLPNLSSLTMVLEFTRSLTEMNTKNLPGG